MLSIGGCSLAVRLVNFMHSERPLSEDTHQRSARTSIQNADTRAKAGSGEKPEHLLSPICDGNVLNS